MQHGAEQTQALVRHRREPDAISVRVEEPGLADEELKVARERAHLPRELLLRAGRDAVPGACGRLEEHAVAAANDAERISTSSRIVSSGIGSNSSRRMA
jgi:hypothetical protein